MQSHQNNLFAAWRAVFHRRLERGFQAHGHGT